jgi:hypothetical protein
MENESSAAAGHECFVVRGLIKRRAGKRERIEVLRTHRRQSLLSSGAAHLARPYLNRPPASPQIFGKRRNSEQAGATACNYSRSRTHLRAANAMIDSDGGPDLDGWWWVPKPGPALGEERSHLTTLGLVKAPRFGHSRNMPPVPDTCSDTIDFLCGNCGTLLMHVREGQVHGVFIHCTECGACNTSALQQNP